MLTERGLDWVFNGLGAIALIVGGIVVLWALLADRARGRKRCPKCWYDLSASPEPRCSECGFVARTERKLRKTRRHWRGCLLGLFIIVLGVSGPAYRVYKNDWRNLVPTTALILWMPDLETEHADLYDALETRMADGRLTDRQWEWLLDRCLDDDNLPVSVQIKTRERWPEGVDIHYEVTWSGRTTHIQWLDDATTWGKVVPRWSDAEGNPIPEEPFESTSTRFLPDRLHRTYGTLPAWPAGDDSLQFDIELALRYSSGGRLSRAFQAQPFVNFGTQSPGTSGIVFSPRTGLRTSTQPKQGPELKRTIPLDMPIVVGGALHDAITPVRDPRIDAALQEGARVRLTYDGLYCFLPAHAVRPLEGITFGLVFELRRDEAVVSTGSVLIDAGYSPIGFIVYMDQVLTLADIRRADDATWTVRIRGDGGLALLDFDATKYWDGELILPMYFEDSSRLSPIWANSLPD